MNPHILRIYKEQRAAGVQARQALLSAKYREKTARLSADGLAFDFSRGGGAYPGESQEIELPGGFSLVATIYPDSDDYSRFFDDDSAPEFDRLPDSPPDGVADGHIDRDGRAWWRVSPGWYSRGWHTAADCGYTLADRARDNRARGMARGPAWQQARADLKRYFDYWRPIYDGRASIVGCVVELRDASSETLSEDTCWGFCSGDDGGAEEFANEAARTLLGMYVETITTRYAHATRQHAAQSARVRALAGELRAVRRAVPAGVAPNACGAVRDAMRTAWDSARDAMRTARALRDVLPTVADTLCAMRGVQ